MHLVTTWKASVYEPYAASRGVGVSAGLQHNTARQEKRDLNPECVVLETITSVSRVFRAVLMGMIS